MNQDIAILEKQMAPLAPHFAQVLGTTMPVERLIRTVIVSVERAPKLLQCDRQSLFNAAMSAAVLGLEVDGVTGQAFLIPFKNRAQLVIGYKGMNTLAARAELTISGAVVRDGDFFEFDLGASTISHKPVLNNKGRIVAAWARAAHLRRPPVIVVLGIDELLAVKAKSPGAKMPDSPWNDPSLGFVAQCEKTAKRRLWRSLPLSVMQLAARMDEAVNEQDKPAWISPERGVIIDGAATDAAPTPTAAALIGSKLSPQSPGDAAMTPPRPVIGQDGAGAGDDIKENDSDRLDRLDNALSDAAKRGMEALQACWESLDKADRVILKPALERRHKRAARRVDDAGDVP